MQGCEECRKRALSTWGPPVRPLWISVPLHSTLFQCRKCDSYWIDNNEDAPRVVSEKEAMDQFIEAFERGRD